MKWRELARLMVGCLLFAGVGGLWGYAAQGMLDESRAERAERSQPRGAGASPASG